MIIAKYFEKVYKALHTTFNRIEYQYKGVFFMEDNKIIITVSGTDKVGIVAMVAQILADYKINIEDIKQTLMQGHFVMFMLCDISESTYNFKEIKNALIEEGNKLEVEIWVQKKGIFEKMHTIS